MDEPIIEQPVKRRINTANTGAAPKIRRMRLRYPELSKNQIAKRVGCDPANVHRVLARFLGDDISEEDHITFREHTAEILSRSKHRILKSVSDADIANASLRDRMVAFGILHDKEQVLLGKPTDIGVTAIVDAVAMLRAMREDSD
jgi:hypothetical protein